jgi:hypothetical protein
MQLVGDSLRVWLEVEASRIAPLAYTMIIWCVRWWSKSGFISISVLLSVRIRERRPAFCGCQKAALWRTCAGRVLSRGCADLLRATTMYQRQLDGTASVEVGSWVLRRPSRLPRCRNPHQLR